MRTLPPQVLQEFYKDIDTVADLALKHSGSQNLQVINRIGRNSGLVAEFIKDANAFIEAPVTNPPSDDSQKDSQGTVEAEEAQKEIPSEA